MPKFLKDVIYPGTYTVADRKGGRRRVTYTREQVRHLSQRMQEMISAGLSIPLAAEHQSKAIPLTAAERKAEWVKKLTMGWAEAAELTPEGYLASVVEVPDEEDARRLPAVRFVSPEIQNDFVDGSGKLWPGPSITHLAVTPRPVQIHQRPFERVSSSTVRLSLTDYEGPEMADEIKPDEDGGDGGKKGFDLEALRKVLAEDGYSVPEQITDPSQFLEHLHTAALSKKAALDAALGTEEEEEEEEEEETPDETPGNPEPAPGPVMMSLCGRRIQIMPRKRGREPRTKGKKKPSGGPNPTPTRLSQGAPRQSAAEANLLKRERAGVLERIGALFQSGRITKPIHDKLKSEAGTVRLSLDDSGELAGNSLLTRVGAYEELPAGSAWPTTGALPEDVRAVEPPLGTWSPEGNREAVSQTVDAFFDTLPGQPAGGQRQ
jgi:hypothetical protein